MHPPKQQPTEPHKTTTKNTLHSQFSTFKLWTMGGVVYWNTNTQVVYWNTNTNTTHTYKQKCHYTHTNKQKSHHTHIQAKRSSHTHTYKQKSLLTPPKYNNNKKWHIDKSLTLQRFSSHLRWLVLASLELSFVHCSKITWSTPSTQRLSLWFLLRNRHHVLFGRLTRRKGARCFGGIQLLGCNSFLVLTFIPPPNCAKTHSTRTFGKQHTDTDSLTW